MKVVAALVCMSAAAVSSQPTYSGIVGVIGGHGNTASGDGAVVVGGSSNAATQDYTSVAGGSKNKAYAKYSAVLGGLSNVAVGKFSVVAGSSQSLANGRKTLAMGYNATIHGDHSAALSFNGQGCEIPDTEENTIKMCADDLTYNGVSLMDVSTTINRRSLSEDADVYKLQEMESLIEAKEAEFAAWDAKMTAILAERDQLIARNAQLIAEKL